MTPAPPRAARRLAAEALGTALLLAAIVGSGIMAERLYDGALGPSLLANAFAIALALFVLIAALAPVSGAHFNPAVTLAEALRGALPPRLAIGYVTAQALGGLAGTLLAHAMFEETLVQVGTTVRSGPGQWIAEAVATGGLLLVIRGTARGGPFACGAAVGAFIGAAIWFTSSTAFANPAVTVARVVTDTFTGMRPLDMPAFVAVQCVTAALAGPLIDRLLGHPVAAARETA